MSNLLQRATDSVACQMLNDIGSAATQIAAWTMWTGKPSLVPLTVGGLSYMANNLLCDPTDGPPETNNPHLDGCIKGSNPSGYAVQYKNPVGDTWGVSSTGWVEIVSVQYVYRSAGYWGHRLVVKDGAGNMAGIQGGFYATENEAIEYGKYRLDVPEGECEDSNDPNDPGNPRPITDPYEYTDPETNCNYTLKLEGFVQQYKDGPAQPVWNIQSSDLLRADGGRMGGCNLAPTIVIGGNGDGPGGPNGGPPQLPAPPEIPGPGPDGEPWWLGPLLGGTTAALLNQLFDMLKDLAQPTYSDGSFTLVAPCNKDEQGNNLQRTWNFPASKYPERVVNHQVALMEIMQQHLDWKTPICRDTPTLDGDYRTISFRSDETSPFGKSRLRKRFRYRSVSGNDLGAVVDHWKDFTWEGGPYRVRWVGSTWRTPEVWAASEAEGQRVIQHAAREAGFDPLEGGEWRTRLSSSTRLGVVSNFRVDTTGGYYWITARDGSDQRPTVAT